MSGLLSCAGAAAPRGWGLRPDGRAGTCDLITWDPGIAAAADEPWTVGRSKLLRTSACMPLDGFRVFATVNAATCGYFTRK